jgi:hypothetical protein
MVGQRRYDMEIFSLLLAVITAGMLGYGEAAYPTTRAILSMELVYVVLYIIDAIIRVMIRKKLRWFWAFPEMLFWIALAYGLEQVQNYHYVNRLPFTGWVGGVMTGLEFILVLFVTRWVWDFIYYLKEQVRKHYESL